MDPLQTTFWAVMGGFMVDNIWLSKCLRAGEKARDAGRHAEAYEAYQRGLKQIPPWHNAARARSMAQLSVTAFDAGHPQATVEWANHALQNTKDLQIKLVAHAMAGVGYSTQGLLAQSENSHRAACQLAEATGQTGKAAECLANLADLQKRQGKLDEALRAGKHALSLSDGGRRQAFLIISETQRAMGLFDESMDALRAARAATPLPNPVFENRMQAAYALSMAWCETEAGCHDEALRHVGEARRDFDKDEKMRLWCDATESWILARLGRIEESARKSEEAVAGAAKMAYDRQSQLGTWSWLGMAAISRGENEVALKFLEHYLSIGPDPVGKPGAWYHIGLARENLGRHDAAKEAWQQSVNFNIATHYAKFARQKLDEA